MPAVRPRITVVLNPDTLDVLRRAAKVQGESVSKLVSGMCDELVPGLERVAHLGEVFQASTLAQKESVRAGLEAADDEVRGRVQDAIIAMTALDEVVAAALGAASEGPQEPPSSNTGVR